MQCEYFALEGLSDLVNTVRRIRQNKNADLQIIGLLRVMFDARLTLQKEVSSYAPAGPSSSLTSWCRPAAIRPRSWQG